MLPNPLWYLTISALVLVVLVVLYVVEDARDDRIVLKRMRHWLDRGCLFIGGLLSRISRKTISWIKFVVLSYGVLWIVKNTLHYIRSVERGIENSLRQHRMFLRRKYPEREDGGSATYLKDMVSHRDRLRDE